MFPNKYEKSCQVCRRRVPVGDGFCRKESGGWITYCADHAPERIMTSAVRNSIQADGSLTWTYSAAELPLVRSFPGYRNTKVNDQWQASVSVTESDRERMLELANRLGFDVAPELRVVTITERAQAVEQDCPEAYPFQVKGVQFLASGTKRLLADSMGLGKSFQALKALPINAAALVICPACIKYTWVHECHRWRPDLTPVVLSGKDGFRWPKAGEICIVNFDVLPTRLQPKKDERKAIIEDADREAAAEVFLVVDELHRVKNFRTQRSKRVKTISTLVKSVWALTGTPLLNRPSDLYGCLESVGMAYQTFGGWPKFMSLFNASKDRWGGIQWGAPKPEVPEMLRRVMLRRTREEVLPDLPRKTITTLVINGMNSRLRSRMDELLEEWEDVLDLETLPPFEFFSKIRAELAASRIDAVTEYVEDCEEQEIPLVVASAHRAPIDALKHREGWDVITGDTPPEKRQDVVRRFQAGELKGVGLTIQAGGVGITLTRAWRMLFVDLDWTPANNSQCEDRICRIGQESQKVEIVRIVSDHVLDQHILRLIARKIDLMEKSIETIIEGPAALLARQLGMDPNTPAGIVWNLAKERGLMAMGETEQEYQSRMTRIREENEDRTCYSCGMSGPVADVQEAICESWCGKNLFCKFCRAKDHAVQTNYKVKEMAQRFTDRIGAFLSEPMTTERETAIREAFAVMLENDPDQASQRNHVGFNRPDSMLAHYIMRLETSDELVACHGILWKYKKQLGKRFPILWPN